MTCDCDKCDKTRTCRSLQKIWTTQIGNFVKVKIRKDVYEKGQIVAIVLNPGGQIMYRVQYPCEWGKTSAWFTEGAFV